MTSASTRPTVLIILDGWGHREEKQDNAVAAAQTPNFDRLFNSAPNTLISGSGMDVGLPDGQMGNSEVGHMNLGAGRVVYQNFTRVSKSIADGEFFSNSVLTTAVDGAVAQQGAVHIMGLLSPGGVHSHEDQIDAMVDLAQQRGAQRIYLHAFLDGRDVAPRSAQASLQRFDDKLRSSGAGQVASIIGRYYAMDRDQRWERVEPAYKLLTDGVGVHMAENACAGLLDAYARDESDEFVSATAINNTAGEAITMNAGDALIFMNFRADRAREISRAFVEADFAEFERASTPKLSSFTTLTEYSTAIDAPCAFVPEALNNVLGAYVADKGLRQLRIAETEKYAHVTFFFSGGEEALFDGEERELIPSPDVATYDLQPEMNAALVTDKMVAAITGDKYELIVCNFANGDMVGHTGNFAAAVIAVETLDKCIGRIETALAQADAQCLITADHGNCEQMMDHDSGQAHTAHTCELVPLLYLGRQKLSLRKHGGALSDIAPTLLQLMGLTQPVEMTGHSLITKVF